VKVHVVLKAVFVMKEFVSNMEGTLPQGEGSAEKLIGETGERVVGSTTRRFSKGQATEIRKTPGRGIIRSLDSEYKTTAEVEALLRYNQIITGEP
jgi:hypothetical protein